MKRKEGRHWTLSASVDWSVWGVGIEVGLGFHYTYLGVTVTAGPAMIVLERDH